MIRKHVLTVVFVMVGALLLAGIAVQLPISRAMAQAGRPDAALAPAVDAGGTFTYQGSLQQNGVAFDGSCDVEFRLFDALTAGTQVGATQTKSGQAVSKGRFTTVLDFGAKAFNGQARWLEIAARCPSGSGGLTTLSPRQPLTAAPYALSLQPGAVVAGSQNAAAGILNLANNGSGAGLTVNSAVTGVLVQATTGNGVQVDSANFIGVDVESAGGAGVFVNAAGNNGVQVGSAGNNGVQVESAIQAGVRVISTTVGMQVDQSVNGLVVGTATGNGVQVNSSATNGVFVDAALTGFRVRAASGHGVAVNSAAFDGLSVGTAGQAGVHVASAPTGVWVQSTTETGVRVDSASTGVWVDSAGLNGVYVGSAPNGNGFVVGTANTGVYVISATNWAGYFNGPVFAKTCTGCALAAFGINTGTAALAPGDIAAIQGTRPGGATGQAMLMEVGQVTQSSAPVVGVVVGRGELVTNVGPDGKTITQLVPREGAVQVGDYVHIVIYGPVQVKASALGKTIATGDKLAVDSSGAARGLKTVEVSGVQLAESAPTIGMALENLEASKSGLIWVLVNPK